MEGPGASFEVHPTLCRQRPRAFKASMGLQILRYKFPGLTLHFLCKVWRSLVWALVLRSSGPPVLRSMVWGSPLLLALHLFGLFGLVLVRSGVWRLFCVFGLLAAFTLLCFVSSWCCGFLASCLGSFPLYHYRDNFYVVIASALGLQCVRITICLRLSFG